MKYIGILIFFLFSITASSCENHDFKGSSKIADSVRILRFIPDTSINKVLFIGNSNSIIKFLGNITTLLNHDEDFPSACLLNKSKQQYVKLVLYPGSSANSISQFEVGYASELDKGIKCYPIELDSLYTESKMQLGISKADIIKIKGIEFKKKVKDSTEVISYSLDNFDGDPFLKRYNMPVYVEEFYLKNDRLFRFRFGFEYP